MPVKEKQPKVGVLLLTTDGRSQYLERALRCLEAQTYKHTDLIVVDSSRYNRIGPTRSIGALRNMGAKAAVEMKCDVIVHWDDDDYSFPGRIERQLEQLKPVHAVGWRELAFWDSTRQQSFRYFSGSPRYACGTSLCYRAEEWQKNPFPDLQVGEDAAWCAKVKPYGMLNSYEFLIAEIHGSNTSSHVDPNAEEWTRTPSRDAHLAKVMAL